MFSHRRLLFYLHASRLNLSGTVWLMKKLSIIANYGFFLYLFKNGYDICGNS